jgi:hypothetical protein
VRRELELIAGKPRREPPLPLTAGRDEIFEFQARGELPRSGDGASAVVRSPDVVFRRWLEDLLRMGGYEVASVAAPHTTVLVWDADPWDAVRAAAFAADRRQFPQTRIAALVGFPRSELAAELRQLGAERVLPKLASAASLLAGISAAPDFSS